ncbi:MAG TPA: GNAT family N-acetyltransferase [Dehalococcoidia bacterium]|nr:GNAT family N-acetyltransferase [Dehalococcoidia bacterium]
MDQNHLLRLACETNFSYLALGNKRFEAHGASFIVNPKTPRRHDANCVGIIRTDPSEVEALLVRIEAEFAGYQHRTWGIDALTPPQTAARLALEQGYRVNDALVHVLEGDLRIAPRLGTTPPDEAEVREVLTEDDWQAYRELDAMWWEETSTGYFGPYDPVLHDEFMVYRRLKTPLTRAWFASVAGVPRAFFSSWLGENGVGIVEDLYCHPDYRHRGLATALIARAVADCRERGAGPVIINSDVNDTPKLMYAAMGFRPLFVHRNYTKRLDGTKDAPA